ncbi:winged helix-turn-helix domain-containing protein [Candidatus Colwellia aromaticivorans]|nr:helix-turn-helix domain-containing protein [Candidatus Colwellia aromaticivorans]
MHLLRKKVECDPDNPHWIITIKGVGYKLHI